MTIRLEDSSTYVILCILGCSLVRFSANHHFLIMLILYEFTVHKLNVFAVTSSLFYDVNLLVGQIHS